MKRFLRTLALTLAMSSAVLPALHAGISFESGEVPHLVFRGSAFFVPSGGGRPARIPFAFAISCQTGEGNPNAYECAGGMQFRFTGSIIAKNVRGVFVRLDAPFPEDTYQVTVASEDGSVACTLTNTPPITDGRTNRIALSCAMPSGTGQVENAVVIAHLHSLE